MTLTATTPTGGRPRDESRDAAILEATRDVLREVGYDLLTIEAVAAKAKASKATVYRRWSGKAALVVEAIKSTGPQAGPDGQPPCYWPDTGSLREDLLAGAREFVARLNSEQGELLCSVMTAQLRDPELAATMRATSYEDKRRSCRLLAERAIARGELTSTAGVDTFVEVLPAMMFNRLLLSGQPLDEEFVVHVVDDVALPLLGARPS